jgi:hypothetical protein
MQGDDQAPCEVEQEVRVGCWMKFCVDKFKIDMIDDAG